MTVLPDATVLTARAQAKVTGGERGARGVMARLVALGARPPVAGEPLAVWLAEALATIGATRLRHPGNHRYLIRCGPPAQRRRTHIALAARPYPKCQVVDLETDVVAGFVLARAAAGITDRTIEAT